MMSLLRSTTHIDPARLNLILQLIPAAADALVHLLGLLAAAMLYRKFSCVVSNRMCNRSHKCMPQTLRSRSARPVTACLAGCKD